MEPFRKGTKMKKLILLVMAVAFLGCNNCSSCDHPKEEMENNRIANFPVKKLDSYEVKKLDLEVVKFDGEPVVMNFPVKVLNTSYEKTTEIEESDGILYVDGLMVEDVAIEMDDELYHLYINGYRYIRVTTDDGNVVWKMH